VIAGGFADALGRWVRLTEGERQALARLEERTRPLKRGQVLVRENDPSGELFLLARGTVMSYVLTKDGSRQILRFQFPGDLLGSAALAYPRSTETLAALTDALVCPFDRAAFAGLIAAHPRLAGVFLSLHQADRAALTDRLAALGRAPARARVAGLLVEMHERLATAGQVRADGAFVLGLTQEEIGDATGLTAVHVNRTLRLLEEEGLIVREQGRIRLAGVDALKRQANYVNRFDGLVLDWLPPAP